MDYICACYWPEETSSHSMVLKHMVFHKEGIPVVFCALAEGEGCSDFINGVTDWFYENRVRFCRKNSDEYVHMKRNLNRVLKKHSKRLKSGVFLLCIGNCFFLWKLGEQRVWILNTGFGKTHYRSLLLQEEEQGILMQGSLEAGVGILVGTEGFFAGTSEEELQNCLSINNLQQEVKAQKRLAELGEAAKRKGEKHPAAMLIITCMEKG